MKGKIICTCIICEDKIKNNELDSCRLENIIFGLSKNASQNFIQKEQGQIINVIEVIREEKKINLGKRGIKKILSVLQILNIIAQLAESIVALYQFIINL